MGHIPEKWLTQLAAANWSPTNLHHLIKKIKAHTNVSIDIWYTKTGCEYPWYRTLLLRTSSNLIYIRLPRKHPLTSLPVCDCQIETVATMTNKDVKLLWCALEYLLIATAQYDPLT